MKKGLKLAPIFCNGMILQRDRVNDIYGTDTDSDRITVCFMGREYGAVPDGEGDFSIFLPPVPAGGPYRMTVTGSCSINISDILFGDIFLLAGQSNMGLPIRRVLDHSAEEVGQTCEPEIRQYLPPADYRFSGPQSYMAESSWCKAAGEELMEFSAAGYFLAKEIRESYHIPVGLIMAAVGGSTIEAWMSRDSLHKFGEYEPRIKDFYDQNYFQEYRKQQEELTNQWLHRLEEEERLNLCVPEQKGGRCQCEPEGEGYQCEQEEFYQEWKTCLIPSLVSDYRSEPFQGSVYLCREVLLEEETSGSAELYMGTIIDSDRIWINGILVGRTEYRYPPRKYSIPQGVLRTGANLILLRVVINRGNGGTIKGKPYYLSCNGKRYSLEGKWHYRIGKKADTPMPDTVFPAELPTGLYHTAIAPFKRIALRGILWYQGEGNTAHPEDYAEKFEEMLTSWRGLFGWEVPCIYVQLPNYLEPFNPVSDSGWAQLRDQQRRNLDMREVAMVVALDIGEANDLHPQNKKELGVRLAKAARYLIYHEKEQELSPVPEEASVSGGQVMIRFRYLEESALEQEINHFELAGEDGIFYPAKAVRKGNRVIVTCGGIACPVFVRYAWCDNPENLNFYNSKGLPAACFQMELLSV